MTCLRELQLDDLFKFNALVFDPLTEVYRLNFFLRHIAQWPELAEACLRPDGQLIGFIFGKCLEGLKGNVQLHGHVCALTVSIDYRRLGVASRLMSNFSKMLNLCGAWYVDLYLRCSNVVAFNLYCALGFKLRRVLLDYYPGNPEEDAFDMRKPLDLDSAGLSLALASKQAVRQPSDENSDDDF